MYKLSGCDNRPKLPSKLAFSTLHPYRRVHYYCYYCSSVKPSFPSALRRCGFIHGRAGERINIIMCVRPTVPVRAHCFRVRINPPPRGQSYEILADTSVPCKIFIHTCPYGLLHIRMYTGGQQQFDESRLKTD